MLLQYLGGVIMLGISFLPWFFKVPVNLAVSVVLGLIWIGGYLLITDALITTFSPEAKKPLRKLQSFHIFLLGLASTILIEFFGNFLWRVWYYPLFSLLWYFLLIPPILALYFFVLLRGYLTTQALLRHYFPPKKHIRYHKTAFFTIFFQTTGFFGITGISLFFLKAFFIVQTHTLLLFNMPRDNVFSWFDIIFLVISLFCLLEFLEYQHKNDSFLLHMFEHDWQPFLAIIITASITAFTMELFNIPVMLWVYINLPFSHVMLAGIPLLVLLCWPMQYVLMLSLYRVLFQQETIHIWG